MKVLHEPDRGLPPSKLRSRAPASSPFGDAHARAWGLAFALAGSFSLSASRSAAQTPTPSPAPPDKHACAEAFETAQLLKSVGKLDEAVAQAAICGAPSCPKATAVPCAAWQTEWSALLGEVTLEVTDENGVATQAATLIVDAKPALTTVPRSMRLPPGPHAFRVSRPGQPDQTTSVVLAERQRETVRVSFPRTAETARPPVGVSDPAPAGRGPGTRAIPTVSWVLGGVGVAGIGVFAGFGLAGRADQADLEKRCSPRCAPDQAAPAKNKYLVADVGLGVGVVAIAMASYFALRPPSAPGASPATVGLVLTPKVDVPGATLAGRF